jgi:hypothetical protein
MSVFSDALEPCIGQDVEVWLTRLDRPYVGGTLLRVADEGLVIAGKGVVSHWEIERVGCGGREIKVAGLLV